MEPKWLEIARTDIGIAEIAGPKANPRIMQYYRAAGANWAKDDAVPWCGAAMAAWVSIAGFPVPAESARARAWLDWGVPMEQPKPGAITVLKRGADEAAGHVCLFLEDRGDRILVLGGNQGDAVSITSFPKRDVIGYRWPVGADAPRDAPRMVAVPDKPLARSGTVWGALLAALATVEAYLDAGLKTALEAIQRLTEIAPLKAALLEAGANSKAVALGIGVFACATVIARRVRAHVEGRLG